MSTFEKMKRTVFGLAHVAIGSIGCIESLQSLRAYQGGDFTIYMGLGLLIGGAALLTAFGLMGVWFTWTDAENHTGFVR